MDFADHEREPIPNDHTKLTLGKEWTEERFETGEWGPSNKPGIDAMFECEHHGEVTSIQVAPVRYERQGRKETLHGFSRGYRAETQSDEIGQAPDVNVMTAFRVHLAYSPIGGQEFTNYTIAADAGDALAVACWLSQYATDGITFEELVHTHNGTDPSDHREHQPDDNDRVERAFAEQPERCLLTEKRTQSHVVDIPYRYGPLLKGFPTTYQGVPCVPSDISSIVGVISHSAWQEHDVADNLFTAPVQRTAEGEYTLDEEVIELLREKQADAVAVRRLGVD